MVMRNELIDLLRAAGYDGPVSYGKGKLEELLAQAQGETTAEVAPPVDPADAEWEGKTIKLREWHGLKGPGDDGEGGKTRGTVVKVEGEPRKKFEFIEYYQSPTQTYVTVRGPMPNRGNHRYIEPSRILHGINGKPILPRA